jgi:hypothetical protein
MTNRSKGDYVGREYSTHGQVEDMYEVFIEKPEERDLGRDGRIILR